MYAHCAAFLFPSKLEGFGLPVLEAMMFGRKVFSSRLTSLPEVCGSYATYWDSFDPKSMADTVEQGLQGWDGNGTEAVAERSYALGFSYERFVSSYLGIYRKMLGLPPAP